MDNVIFNSGYCYYDKFRWYHLQFELERVSFNDLNFINNLFLASPFHSWPWECQHLCFAPVKSKIFVKIFVNILTRKSKIFVNISVNSLTRTTKIFVKIFVNCLTRMSNALRNFTCKHNTWWWKELKTDDEVVKTYILMLWMSSKFSRENFYYSLSNPSKNNILIL